MMENKDYDYMFKVILLGSVAVGKSKILQRYTRNEFSEHSQTTTGVEYASKIILTAQGKRIKLQIWDTAGQERYKSLMKTYYKGASAVLIVYDITRLDTFERIESEQQSMKEYLKSDIVTMIVGNKVDLEEERVVTKQQGLQYAENKRIAFYEVSAKSGLNVELIFTRVADELYKIMEQTFPKSNEPEAPPQKPAPFRLKQEPQKQSQIKPAAKKCC